MRTSSRGRRSHLGALVVGLALVAGAGLATGCAGPYAGQAERLKKPPKKKMPEVVAAAPVEIKFAGECVAKFQEENAKAMAQHNRGATKARQMAGQGAELLEQAAKSTDDAQVAGLTKEAIGKLRGALLEDPYSAEASYNLAVGYARARRKTCALALLKRLAELEKYDEFTPAARRMLKAAEDDAAFSLFRKEATEAMGR